MADLGRLVPARIRRSYLAKFGLGLLAVVVVIASVGAYTHVAVSAELTDDTQDQLTTTATLQADVVGTWISERKLATRMLSGYSTVEHGSDTTVTQFLVQEHRRMPDDVVAIHRIDREDGHVVASSNRSKVGSTIDLSKLSWRGGLVKSAKPEDVLLSEPHERDGATSIGFASPIGDSGDVIVVFTDATAILAQLETEFAGSRVQVVDSWGNIYLSDDENQAGRLYPVVRDGTPAWELGTDGERGVVERDSVKGIVDEPALVGYAPVPGTNFALVTQVPQSTAYHLLDTIQVDILGLVGAAFVGLVLMGVVIGRTTARDLDDLAGTATAVANGDLDVSVDRSNRLDEVGRVNNAFHDTVAFIDAVADQAGALARQDFDDPAFDRDVPGDLGERLDAMSTDLQSLLADMEAARTDAEAAKQEAEALTDALETKAEDFGDVLTAAAGGDLTQRVDSDSESDAMVRIAHALNEMLADLERTVAETQDFASDVAVASGEVTQGAGEIASASDQVSSSIAEISATVDQQRDSLGEVAGEMSSLSATIEEIAASADQVAGTSRHASARGSEAGENAKDALDQMAAIDETATETVADVEALDSELARISDILDLIRDVASQTNLLALNANIEAARAGAAGDGFAVVADEIKSLAEETAEATGEIETLVEGVQDSAAATVDGMHEMRERVDDGHETVSQALTALDEVVERVDEADEGVQSISVATDVQATSTEETVAMVDEVSVMSDETADEAADVAAAAQQQAASVTQVTDRAGDLAGQADDLQDLLDRFEVSHAEAFDDETPVRTSDDLDGQDAGDEDGTAADFEDAVDMAGGSVGARVAGDGGSSNAGAITDEDTVEDSTSEPDPVDFEWAGPDADDSPSGDD